MHDPARLGPWVARVVDHLHALDETLSLELDLQATEFQQRVWRALRAIPVGETRTYGDVAERKRKLLASEDAAA